MSEHPTLSVSLETLISSLSERLTVCHDRVNACEGELAAAREDRDAVKLELSRAKRAHAALTTTRTRKPKVAETPLFAEEVA